MNRTHPIGSAERFEARYRTRNGGSGMARFGSADEAIDHIQKQYRARCNTTVTRNGQEFGAVWKDDHQGWLWYYDQDQA